MRLINAVIFPVNYRSLGTSLALAMVITGCAQQLDEDGGANSRIILENDEAVLAQRVTYPNTAIAVEALPAKGILSKSNSFAPTNDSVNLTLVAEVEPPSIDNNTLQATEVRVRGQHAYVSYSVKGAGFFGGVEVYDISTPTSPKLISSALLKDTDVHGMTIYRGDVYLAGGSNDPNLLSPAVLERIKTNSGKLSTESEIYDVKSYAATDVDVFHGKVYVTSGATPGYLTVLQNNDLSLINEINIDDARGVDTRINRVAVVAGTPARLYEIDRSTDDVLTEYHLNGADTPDSKSTVEIKQNMAFLGLSDGGTQIVCMDDGSVLHTIAPPVITGLDSALTVTNSVTAYKRALFMGNGEAGVYVGLTDGNFNQKSCDVGNLYIAGKLQFGSQQSVNHIIYRNDMLFVASGLGGLKILTVSINNESPDDDDETDDDLYDQF